MNRLQTQPKPENISCHGCGKIAPRKTAFFMFDFECCSIDCLELLRKQRQASDNERDKQRDSQLPRQGAFTLSSGGGAAY